MRAVFETLLAESQSAHAASPAMCAFMPPPEAPVWRELPVNHVAAARVLERETGLTSDRHAAWRDAWTAASPHAKWRETWKGSGLAQTFLDRFACFELIGTEGHYHSDSGRTFVVYMPAGLHYPWHQHPAEELYYVIAGEAAFAVEGEPVRTCRAGDAVFHPSNCPHALTTGDHPVMAYVLWRGDMTVRPTLSPGL